MQNTENNFQRHVSNFQSATNKNSHFEFRTLSKIRASFEDNSMSKSLLGEESRTLAAASDVDKRLGSARYPLPLAALPNVPLRVLFVLSFLHDTHDLFYYFYFSLIILLNGLFRCSVKLPKFPFQELLAFTATFQYWWMFGLNYL